MKQLKEKDNDESSANLTAKKKTPEGKSDEENKANTGEGSKDIGKNVEIRMDPYDKSQVSLSSTKAENTIDESDKEKTANTEESDKNADKYVDIKIDPYIRNEVFLVINKG